MASYPRQAEARVSELFNSDDSDITLQSSDGVLFKVDSKNLAAYSEAFPASDLTITANGEVVALQETSDVLHLLLQYMHRRRQPDLTNVPFELLSGLAEAAEKYEVYSAMEVCRIHMKAAIGHHPAEVLAYAGRHDYADLMDRAAPLCLGSTADMGRILSGSTVTLVAWTRYCSIWQKVVHSAYKAQNPFDHYGTDCRAWLGCYSLVANTLAGLPESIPSVFEKIDQSRATMETYCEGCTKSLTDWKRSIETSIRAVPDFSALRR